MEARDEAGEPLWTQDAMHAVEVLIASAECAERVWRVLNRHGNWRVSFAGAPNRLEEAVL
jgi:hypothetical protein